MTRAAPVIIAGPLPPPVTGFSYVTQEMTRFWADRHDIVSIDLSPHQKPGRIFYHLRRLRLALRGVAVVLKQAKKAVDVFYIACDGGLGLLYTLALCAAARRGKYRLFIHHHSFAYIDAFNPLMAALLFVAGAEATHIFLSRAMGDRFATRYKKAVKSAIVSNSAFIALPREMPRRDGAALTVGLLGNLNDAKGLHVFLNVLRQADKHNVALRGILAGPADTEKDRHAIAAAQAELDARLDYRGAVYGAAKDDFYRSIDVFIFPTRYANEAQPAVIFEALAQGVPVLSIDRGVIRGQVGACGAVQEPDGDFVGFALSWLRAVTPQRLAQLRLESRKAFIEDQEQARGALARLFTGDPGP